MVMGGRCHCGASIGCDGQHRCPPVIFPGYPIAKAAICGGHPSGASPIPADMMGCGQRIDSYLEVYRCWDCGVTYHADCGKKSACSTGAVLTAEMVDEIERRDREAKK